MGNVISLCHFRITRQVLTMNVVRRTCCECGDVFHIGQDDDLCNSCFELLRDPDEYEDEFNSY